MSTSANIIVGSQVWVEDNEVSWIDGEVLEINDKEIKVQCSSGKEVVAVLSSVYPKDPEFPEGGVDDMTKLAYLHEPGVLRNLKSRFDMDEIYTYTGNILIAVNPFKRIPNLYDKSVMEKYKGIALGELNPHPYAIADMAYRQMVNEGISQSILVSGESGAGKTESTKNLMQYLAYMGGRHGADERSVEQQVLESNPVLEAFGNAKTVRNNNSSRFGKFVELQFNEIGKISGAAIRTYLLERSRVCQVSDPERSYHCFYMLCAAPPEVSEKYKLGDPRTFHYLNQSNCYQLTGVDESKEYLETIHAMGVVGINSDEQEAIFRVVAAILHLGNIEFSRGSEPDSSQPKDDKSRFHLKTAAELFMCDETALQESFCQRVMVTRGESIKKSLDPNSAAISRDAMAKIVYSKLFDWIVTRINNSIGQDANSKLLIGVLDIYGFESFKTNSFEQFCINLTNEKLQQHFNQHVFKMEQEEYSKEEINWSYIEFVDNQDILDLIEKKPGGILALLDEACMFPRSTHATFADKLYQTFKDHKRFSKPKLSNTDFTICHYAGDVTYQSDFFLDKNKDYVVAEHQALMNASKCFFVSSLFPPLAQDSSKASKFISIGSQFKQQLQALLETLSHTEPHYVRCVKPNNLLKPAIFDNPNILQQLRCGGVMEAIRISCAGFPTRKPFHEFIDRFKILSPNVLTMSDEIEASKILLQKANLEGYQIGKTKVFLRAGQMAEIDARRSEVLGRSAIKIQKRFRGYSTCNKYTLLRSSAIVIQTICRGEVARVCYERRRKERACLRIQKNARMHRERTRYKSMSSSVIFIQNGMRGMAARNAYNYKRKTKAAIGIQSRCRRHLALRRYVKMRKVAVYAQSVLRKDLARIELKRLKKIASDTSALQDAKNKLEQEAKELAMRLQEEERNRADMEEAKKKETLKLQSTVKEMEVQLAEMEEAKNNENAKLQSAIKELEVQLADMEQAKNMEKEKLESALKEMEVQLANMEEAKNEEKARLESTIKGMEAELADMEEAKKKETAELQSAITEMENKLADMEETKNKENAKLQSTIEEMEVQFQEIKELLEAAKREMEQVRVADNEKIETLTREMEQVRATDNEKIETLTREMEQVRAADNEKIETLTREMEQVRAADNEKIETLTREMEQLRAADNEKIETLTTDNEKLKGVVNSLESEINETQKKYEETSKLSEDRLKEAMDAEAKIIDLKLDMQCLQEKIADMEAEDQILRQKEHQSGSPSNKFNSNLTQSTIGRERELVDNVMKAATEDLGFSQGKPVATYVIYKSLLHCKAFEPDITTVFDRIIQMMGSAIEKSEEIKHMAYWLSVTSTLLFLIQRTLSPSPPKPEQPTSLFGRMTKGFRSASIISIVCHVEVKYPALLFKKQLAAYVEKLYGFIRNDLKKDMSQLLASCIQAPITSDGKVFPVEFWDSIIERLDGLLDTLKECNVPLGIIQKIFSQVFSFTDVQLFNSLLLHKECCTFANGEYVKAGLSKLEVWCSKVTAEYAGSSSDELNRVRQAIGFMVSKEKSKISYDEFTTKLCPVLSIQQLHRLCTFYSNNKDDTDSAAPDLISKLKGLMSEDSSDPDSDSYLVDDNTSSMAFPVEEIGKSINEKDFSNMKPSPELLEKPEFQFLLE
ncbi:putative myosin ATPase [Helianthus annuus]|nr:putative myosin ATPase [Helianthus annuus]KAJ0518405.1 putative myosin ATPase [Helianthus annuus]KAJ0686439.1 putative myosin ATPase [Helianthus annuus]KAJ0690259.1 putative myosin ATPase [Helianthus annuus]